MTKSFLQMGSRLLLSYSSPSSNICLPWGESVLQRQRHQLDVIYIPRVFIAALTVAQNVRRDPNAHYQGNG